MADFHDDLLIELFGALLGDQPGCIAVVLGFGAISAGIVVLGEHQSVLSPALIVGLVVVAVLGAVVIWRWIGRTESGQE